MTPEASSWTPYGQPLGTPPILFVHGLLHGAWCWTGAWREFFHRQGFATYCMSLPGHGDATVRYRQGWTSLADYADSVVDVAVRFDESPILVGHSLGAMLLQMRLHQLNPPALVLLTPTSPAAFRWAAWRHFRRYPRLSLRVHAQQRPRLAIPAPQQCREWFFSDSTPDDVVTRCFAHLEEESYRVCLELLLRPKGAAETPTRTPVLVLGAEADQSVPRQAVEQVASRYGVQAEFFEGMGHDLMLEPGWRRVAERIIRWLSELGLTSTRLSSVSTDRRLDRLEAYRAALKQLEPAEVL